MTELTAKQRDAVARWTAMKRRGRTRFLLVDSLLVYLFAIGLGQIVFEHNDWNRPLGVILRTLCLGLILGYALGSLSWWEAKRAYAKATGGNDDPAVLQIPESSVSSRDFWLRLDRAMGPAIEVLLVVMSLAAVAGLHWNKDIVLWARGARAADKTGLLAYWSFDDCTAKDSSANRFTGSMHLASCMDGVSGKALLLTKNGGYLSFPRVLDSVWDEMSFTYCARSNEGSGGQAAWHAVAVNRSYFSHKNTIYYDGMIQYEDDLPEHGHFPRGAFELGRSIDGRTGKYAYGGGMAIDELRAFSRTLTLEEILGFSKACRKGTAAPAG